MSIGPIVNLASGFIQSLISHSSASTNTTAAGATTAPGAPKDTNQLSPLAQILSTLQNLQQSNPVQYQQVTQQISNNLQTAAQSATSSGNTALAAKLTQLSQDFSKASTTGQLPNVQDLAQAAGGHHHHHHHGGGGASAASGATTANDRQDPLSIISATLSSASAQSGS